MSVEEKVLVVEPILCGRIDKAIETLTSISK